MGGTIWGPDGTMWGMAGWVWRQVVVGASDHLSDEELRAYCRHVVDDNINMLDLREFSPAQQADFRQAFHHVHMAFRDIDPAEREQEVAYDSRLWAFEQLAVLLRRPPKN